MDVVIAVLDEKSADKIKSLSDTTLSRLISDLAEKLRISADATSIV